MRVQMDEHNSQRCRTQNTHTECFNGDGFKI